MILHLILHQLILTGSTGRTASVEAARRSSGDQVQRQVATPRSKPSRLELRAESSSRRVTLLLSRCPPSRNDSANDRAPSRQSHTGKGLRDCRPRLQLIGPQVSRALGAISTSDIAQLLLNRVTLHRRNGIRQRFAAKSKMYLWEWVRLLLS